MNNVPSLEISKELYELSGWETKSWANGFDRAYPAPRYDLGYLIRKLPRTIGDVQDLKFLSIEPVSTNHSQWSCFYSDESYKHLEFKSYAETAEDSVAQLAIQLFKAGILTKGATS